MMKKSAIAVALAAALLAASMPLFAEGAPEKGGRGFSPVSSGLEETLRSKGVVIIPETFLRGYDPITVFYARSVGPAAGGPLDNPGDLLSVSPAVPGEYRFVDARTVQFLPAVAWPALKNFTVKARGASRTLFTLMVPPTSLSPSSGSRDLEPISSFTLTFPNEIPPADLASMISFEIKALPGVGEGAAVRLTADDFTVKLLDKTDAGTSNRYRLELRTPVPYGRFLTLSLRLSLDGELEGSLASYTFATKREFRLIGMSAGYAELPVAANGSVYSLEQAVDCGDGRSPVTLRFSEALAPLGAEAVKRLARFEPAVRDFRFSVEGDRLVLMFGADKNTPYKLTLSHFPLKSASGRKLMPFGETSFYFYYRQLDAYLQWKSGQAVVERFGPRLFPMEGRGLTRADLRVYKIDPENRNFWPFPASPVAVDEDSRPPMPGEEPPYGENLRSQIRLLGTPHDSRLIDLPIRKTSGASRFGFDLGPILERVSGKDAPGTYLVGCRLLGPGSRRTYVRLVVTDLSLSTVEEENEVVFVVTSLKTGRPVAGARISVEGERRKGKSRDWVPVVSGTTDARGFFRYVHREDIEETIRRIIVSSGDDKVVFDPANPPPVYSNNHWSDEGSRWLSFLNSDPVTARLSPSRRAYLFTERPLYRPEEPVYVMGYVRLRQQGVIKPDDASRERKLVVYGPGGKQWTYPVALGPNQGFSVKFDRKDIPTGDYTASLIDVKAGSTLASVPFKKEAYRVPTFEVALSGPDRVPLDRQFEIVLTADYYAGGRVAGQAVTWEITKYPYSVRPSGLPGFTFSSDEAFSGGRDYESGGASVVHAVTDAEGSARLTLNPAAENAGAPRVFVVEATVKGADLQTVTAVKRVVAVPAFAIGLKVDRFIKDAKTIPTRVVVIGFDEKPLAGKPFTVRLYHREWHSYLSETDFTTGEVKYHTDVVDKKVFEKSYRSAAEPLAIELDAGAAGVYVVEALAKDSLGRLQKVQSDLYLAGKEPVSWEKSYAGVFETSFDRESYAPGDRVTLLLKSPFQDARALVVVEGPDKNEYHWTDVRGGQGLFTFTVCEDMVPGVPVHALLLRGRLPGTGTLSSFDSGSRVDRGRPIAMAATARVKVDSVRNRLKVSLDHEKTSLPGKQLKMKIIVKDWRGAPVDGTASLWLVDRAVLSLGQERPLRPLDAFIDPVSSTLRVHETRNEVVGNLPIEEIPGGDDGEAAGKMRSESASRDEAALELFKKTTVRRNFQTVPYINPAVPVKNGLAEITIDLPDNLTDFSVRCVAAADYDKFGTAGSVVSIHLPVIIQTALPRFVRPGDEFRAGGIGRIVEGSGGPGTAAVEVEGLKLKGGAVRDSRPLQWKKNAAERIYFDFLAPESLTPGDTAAVRMAVERSSDKAGDGFELKLPVRLDTQTLRKDAFVRADGSAPVSPPAPDYKPRPGTMKVTVVATYEPEAVKLLAAMRFLADYPHGCTEQRVSKLYPALALKETLGKLGLKDTYTVPGPVFKELLAYLESALTPQGLYSYWPGSDGYVSLTAYVVEFLTLAKKAGYDVPDKLLSRPLQALKDALRSDYDYFISGYSFRERVESMSSLTAAGRFDDQYAYDLLVGARNQDLYSQAKILSLFLANKKGDAKQVKDLLDAVWSKTVFKLKDKKEMFAGLQYGDMAWGGLVLSSRVRTNAQVIRALQASDPESARVRLMIDDLLSRADDSGWGNTCDNVSALLAVSSLLESSAAPGRSHVFEITAGGTRVTLDTGGKSVSFVELETDRPALVKLVSGDKNKTPWLWLTIEYVPDVTADRLPSENKGFVVERELVEYGPDKKVVDRRPAKSGEKQTYKTETVIEEHVRVVNPADRNFVAVVVPFAAGFEPMNPNLATSSKDAAPAGGITRRPSYALYADDSVTFYYDTLPKGTYDFYFRTRASFSGSYTHPGARAELMYDLKVYGRSAGTRIEIVEGPK
ncbi:MAG: hypothetical protein JXD23_17795 [Spirochaetales bacterium]|nr:hypothetical protein [Spirochaetales bacterium]